MSVQWKKTQHKLSRAVQTDMHNNNNSITHNKIVMTYTNKYNERHTITIWHKLLWPMGLSMHWLPDQRSSKETKKVVSNLNVKKLEL
jgi:hypothetical protein